MTFIEDFKHIFKRKDNGLIKIIVINIIVFIVVNIASLFFNYFINDKNIIPRILAINANLTSFILKPWTLFTYMFLHLEIMHILTNMLWLYFIGKIFVDFMGNARLIYTYMMGGITGGLLFVLLYNLFPSNNIHYLLGASAGVMAAVVGAATLVPDYTIYLLFIGGVRLKYVALFAFIFTTILDFSVNTGGKVAHIGGALFGYFYVSQYKKGNDWYLIAEKIALFFKPKSKLKVAYRSEKSKADKLSKDEKQRRIDAILDKISKSGYDSLSKDEKEFLFKTSKDQD